MRSYRACTRVCRDIMNVSLRGIQGLGFRGWGFRFCGLGCPVGFLGTGLGV